MIPDSISIAVNMKPETRRAVIRQGFSEGMSFDESLEFLIMEGVKAQAGCPASCHVDKPVRRHVDGLLINSWDGGKL